MNFLSSVRRLPFFPARCALGACEFLLAVAVGWAQPVSSDRDDPVVELSRYVVEGVPLEESANPLTRPVTGAFGDARGALDTPRAVSVLNDALFRERAIDGLKEIVAFAPSAYAPSRFGKATVPNVRGDTAESYLNGQRRGYNLFGYFPSFNGVEAVELVRGAGSAVYGSGFFSGGYVNFVTKQPKFSGPETVVTTRLGTWAPGGGSYLNGSLQVDTTAPFAGGRAAWRVSYQGKDGKTFFRRAGVRDDRQDLYAALAWRPREGRTLDLNLQYLWQSSPEILGVNRPSQELIDRGLYTRGEAAGVYGSVIVPTGRQPVSRQATLFSRGDFSNANVLHVQAVGRAELSPSVSLVNRTLAETVDRRRYHAFEYIEYVEQVTVENRTELHASLGERRQHALVSGLALRYEARESFTNYFNEFFFPYDLLSGATVFSARGRYPGAYFPGQAGPGGRPFFGAAFASPETVESELWNPALFHQHEWKVTERWSLLGGWRGEAFLAEAADPLPPAGSPAWSDALEVFGNSWHGSLLWRPAPSSTAYYTYQHMLAANGNVTGGGLLLLGPDGRLRRDDFRNVGELHEVGLKAALLENALFVGAALFNQDRRRVERGGGKDDLRVRGLELEAVYQPRTSLLATANLAWTDGRYRDSAPFQLGGRSIYDLYAAGAGPENRGTGRGYDPFGNQVPSGDWRIPGLSRFTANGSVSYRFANGFGFALLGSVQSPQHGNLDAEWTIPWQHQFNAELSYRARRWEVAVEILNLTDERNWTHNGDTFMNNQIVFQELPLRLEAYAKIKF